MNSLKKTVSVRGNKIIKLKEHTKNLVCEISSLSQTVSEQKDIINSFKKTVSERKEEIVGLSQKVAAQDVKIEKLNHIASSYYLENNAFLSSNNWRITKPLRVISRLLRKLNNRLSAVKPFASLKKHIHKSTLNNTNLPNGFDEDMYLKLNPDVAEAGHDAANHYLLYGRREGRIFLLPEMNLCGIETQNDTNLPNGFDEEIYLKLNPDVAEGGHDATIHYLLYGRHEGRIFLLPEMNLCGIETQNNTNLPNGFDEEIYLKLNPDVAESGLDAKNHYLLHGRDEDRLFLLPEMNLCGIETQNNTNLPNGFDEEIYLKLNPDVAESGFDATNHYLLHGRDEDRLFLLPEMNLCGIETQKSGLETVLMVSHDASRSGAPMLSLNLVQALVTSYNVVVLLLGDGPLSKEFLSAGATVMTSSELRGNPQLSNLVVGQLCERFNFKFALVNSIESSIVLPALCYYYVTAISLFHEFASYTRPRDKFRNAMFWSIETVFSANVTFENIQTEYPDIDFRSTHILPQGRCLLPKGDYKKDKIQTEKKRIHDLIRPDNIAEDSVIILGAGFVQLRKGIDLFIECAAQVVHSPGGEKCRFVWIGKGYNPENELEYSVYLEDQVSRAGLQEHVLFIDETTAIETAYEETDIFLLTSRLDPLPNVAIDAMTYGVPVVCFNKTTGIADFLIEKDLKNYCVADYLNTSDIAGKVLALANEQNLRKQISARCREASVAYFNMKNYTLRLENLAQSAVNRTQQEKADTQVILNSNLFRKSFSCPPFRQGQQIGNVVRAYVREWSSGIGLRKPFPGLHPGIYMEQHGLATFGADPFADYLRAECPEGPWKYLVIVPTKTTQKDLPKNKSIALHLHIYYPEMLSEIIKHLSYNKVCPDLFVSIPKEKKGGMVVNELKKYKGIVADIQYVPNRGRDIGPFLTAFGQRILKNYDFVGHIHTKKSIDVEDASMSKTWHRFLLENLLGGDSGAMADCILSKMKNDTSIGMVFPDDPNAMSWGKNRTVAESLIKRIGISHQKLPEHFVFPIGTMFWAKSSALAPLIDLNLDWDDYPEEPLPYDGTMLHAIERLLPSILTVNNLHYATTNIDGLTR